MEMLLWIAVGSALGGMGRFWCSGFVARRLGETFPWGTLVVNVSGAFVIGAVAAASTVEGWLALGETGRLMAVTGIVASYTTFSSFSLQTLALVQNGQWLRAAGNVVLSVGLCLVAVWGGQAVGLMTG